MDTNNSNPLYPVFLKLHALRLLIVGAGAVGYEKLQFILKSSPLANVTMVATWVSDDVRELLSKTPTHRVTLLERPFAVADVEGHDLVIAAANLPELNLAVRQAAKARGILVNVADTPDLCDFYLGAIVTKGQLKIGISTNGKSPTLAKRVREWLEAALPEEVDELLEHLQAYRKQLDGDFAEKVRRLNELTASLIVENQLSEKSL
jgi:precorrin-2 dehydrogenase/sirohydrochlorin ferrochelatase